MQTLQILQENQQGFHFLLSFPKLQRLQIFWEKKIKNNHLSKNKTSFKKNLHDEKKVLFIVNFRSIISLHQLKLALN